MSKGVGEKKSDVEKRVPTMLKSPGVGTAGEGE